LTFKEAPMTVVKKIQEASLSDLVVALGRKPDLSDTQLASVMEAAGRLDPIDGREPTSEEKISLYQTLLDFEAMGFVSERHRVEMRRLLAAGILQTGQSQVSPREQPTGAALGKAITIFQRIEDVLAGRAPRSELLDLYLETAAAGTIDLLPESLKAKTRIERRAALATAKSNS
jgi:hypothetical protein